LEFHYYYISWYIYIKEISSWKHLIPKGTKELTHNIPYKDLVKPFVGPANPFNPEANENGLENKNTPAGKPKFLLYINYYIFVFLLFNNLINFTC